VGDEIVCVRPPPAARSAGVSKVCFIACIHRMYVCWGHHDVRMPAVASFFAGLFTGCMHARMHVCLLHVFTFVMGVCMSV